MYLANLSFESLEEYLKTLIELELIEPCGENGSVYKTSAKGMKYLSTFAMLRKTVS
jgi:predicted transcriptional regulator